MRYFTKLFLFFLVVSTTACVWQRHEVMTIDQYSSIAIGTPIKTITKTYGPPLSITSNKGRQVYEYVERFSMEGQVVQSRRYFFTVNEDGRIVKKQMTYNNIAPYQQIFQDDFNRTK
jgi:hypothetical protein